MAGCLLARNHEQRALDRTSPVHRAVRRANHPSLETVFLGNWRLVRTSVTTNANNLHAMSQVPVLHCVSKGSLSVALAMRM